MRGGKGEAEEENFENETGVEDGGSMFSVVFYSTLFCFARTF